MTVYRFRVQTAQGQDLPLADYRGKVLLIVNTASRCGLTNQYTELQTLYERYRHQGLEILDFPCNQFRGQAPESSGEYAEICQTQFGTAFTIFNKIHVNGADTHPLCVYLKQQQPKDQGNFGFKDLLLKLAAIGQARESSDIQWNFTKFLVNRQGQVVARHAPRCRSLRIGTRHSNPVGTDSLKSCLFNLTVFNIPSRKIG